MPLTLEQYASYLDTRDLPWPAPPDILPRKAKPYLVELPGVRAVTWSVYGTLLAINGGELYFEHPKDFIMDVALDKTIQEFKMWNSMTRTPGQPVEYLRPIYTSILTEFRMQPSGAEKYPEVAVDRVWEKVIKRLFQKDYKFDAGFYGSLNEFSRKVAYFFHSSLQGTACYPGAADALRHVRQGRRLQGLLGDGQCFTLVHLQRGLSQRDSEANVNELFDADIMALSYDVHSRQPSERLFRKALTALEHKGIAPEEVLHIGSRVLMDVVPARRLGMKTALFAGDKNSVQATTAQLQEPASRPDVLLTALEQITEVVPG
jgi:FMN phosphatase YigB (HAD superfamily)